MNRRRTTVLVTAGCLVVALGAGAAAWATVAAPSTATADTTTHRSTTVVTKGDLVESRTFAGVLGYGETAALSASASGTITWLPEPGQVIHRDEPLYAVDERPVRAFMGTTPLWRDLVPGTAGADVRQLNENLAALGYDVVQDDVFGRSTAAAVRTWQEDHGLTVTGTVTADQIAFVDGDVRVASVPAGLGQPAGGEVLQVTSTRRVVQATVPDRDAGQLAVGTAVEVLVNGTGDAMPGEVTDAEPTESDDGGQSVAVTVSFDAGRRRLAEAASAQVIARGRTERDVLSVPVSALRASDGSGYAVDVVRAGEPTESVRVEVGLVADGRAAVTGDLHEGDRVVVPS
ncbi:efflux RND transporter periplasmic adaptor subunit [Curtobacterium sp. MCBD17_021]|uniref:efflux RND transporter periplasmic adaptor subunit n=1 Tax=Curtobacterium sp. MCBD17_021 TaxID=2175665 RepID=UPI000DA8DC63|nr:peptidoglycan-binding protein [Curtobacterium sp. MCBD17_021]PZE63527.1 efflux RND transporter periplasmic adaptor subunit [Curtobacterium sp. MCBD17_021]